MQQHLNHSLKAFNTLGLDYRCQRLCIIDSTEELLTLFTEGMTEPYLVIGGGSNVVFTENFAGTVIVINSKGVTIDEDENLYKLSVAAGEDWHQFVEKTLNDGMPGLENLALIPGCIGAAPVQNIGAYGVELADVCAWVEYLDTTELTLKRLAVDECQFAYRESIFKGNLKGKAIITHVGIHLAKSWQPTLDYGPLKRFIDEPVQAIDIFNEVCQVRSTKLPDPKVLGNAGSFFKNPIVSKSVYLALKQQYPQIVAFAVSDSEVKLAAGWLIEHAGLKGFTIGDASVHEQQALVLVNNGHATGSQIIQLAEHVKQLVAEQYGVQLEVEPRIIGAKCEKE
ncbi:UDP-N-acetylmuramate dehydrogenase [Shewanella waksmanii]|uniref:UDP-N-acetylmuramate dehydrogenase n=1 Tax=Shewanella waksmanii TaxID=213783 RepID=UPI00373594DF